MTMRFILCLVQLAFAPIPTAVDLPTTGFRAVDYEPELRSRTRPAGKWADLRCTMVRHEGSWTWIHSFEGKEGWVRREEVIPLDRAVDFFTRKIAAQPDNTFWYQSRANAQQELGDLESALSDLSEAIRREPKNHYLYNNRAAVYEAQKEYDRAVADYNAALNISPNEPFYWANAAATRLKMKDYARAIKNCDRAISLDAAFPVAYRIRATALARQGNAQRAAADFTAAARLDPNGPSSYASPAWTRATCPIERCRDGKQAVELAKRACELSQWNDSWCLDVLAAAHAEAGDFDNALKYARQALKLAPALDRPEISKRLELYGTGKPYHDE
jgi:tetratricopeptide (TPR) repeat protein